MTDSVRVTTARSVRRDLVADVVEAAPVAGDMIGIGNVLNAIADAALCIDRDGVIRIANRAAAKLFGYPMDGLTGGSIERLVPESVRERHRPLVAGFFERPVARAMGGGLPLAARRRDGQVFFADISLASVESASHGPLALIMVRDVSDQRRERLIAAQYLITQALVESETLEAAAGAVLEAVGPASGAHVAALWEVDDDGAARFVDSWCASDRNQVFHAQSLGVVVPAGSGVLGGVIASAHVHWCSDVLADSRFDRKDLARRLGLRAGVWIPFPEGQDRVLGVLELLFEVVRDPEPVMLAILESFTAQLAQYLALRRSEADRLRVVGQIVQSVEEERRRIASDLHDDTVQVLVASLVSIDRLDKAIAVENAHAHDLLAMVRETLAAATERTRRLIFDMRPQLLEAEGLMPAIADVAADAGHDAGFDVDVAQTTDRFDPAVEALLYRVMKEAITNARKHSRASHLRCSLETVAGGVIGEVADDGVGFQLAGTLTRARKRMSFGLSSILELVRLAGGHVDVESAPGQGTTVRIWLPLRLASFDREAAALRRHADTQTHGQGTAN